MISPVRRMQAAGPWVRLLVSLLAGAATSLAMAPVDAWPVAFVTIPVLVWLLDGMWRSDAARGRKSWRAFGAGWAFGFGYFVAGLSWVGEAFLVEADKYAWLMPLGVAILPAGLALFYGAAAALAVRFWSRGPERLLLLAATLATADWLRGHVFTGFPWNALGYIGTSVDSYAQAASLMGVYGLGLIAVAVCGVPAALVTVEGFRVRAGGVYAGLALAVVLGLAGWGHWRLAHAGVNAVHGVHLRIVQPDIPQAEKWLPDNRARIFQTYLDLSRGTGGQAPLDADTLLIWPETATPFFLLRSPDAIQAIAGLLPDGALLITGTPRVEEKPATNDGKTTDGEMTDAEEPERDYFNTIAVLDAQGRLVGRYDKKHLVPFGEYMPFQRTLEAIGMRQLTRIKGGFTPGQGPHLLFLPGLPPASALLCYEVIFPGAVAGEGPRPGWLLNLTNDAWFGKSWGPYQHLRQARIRTIEEGLPLVRAANTGISAIIDPYGRIRGTLKLDTSGVLDAPLPESARETLYARFGWWAEICALIATLSSWAALRFMPIRENLFLIKRGSRMG